MLYNINKSQKGSTVMIVTKKGTVIELYIHGMYEDDAKREI